MTVTDYEVGDLIKDDEDGLTGFIFEILSEMEFVLHGRKIAGPFYKVHWFIDSNEDVSVPLISTESKTDISLYRRL